MGLKETRRDDSSPDEENEWHGNVHQASSNADVISEDEILERRITKRKMSKKHAKKEEKTESTDEYDPSVDDIGTSSTVYSGEGHSALSTAELPQPFVVGNPIQENKKSK